MKKYLIVSVLFGLASSLSFADMRYNPINNLIYSYPETINQTAYRVLLVACIAIEAQIISINNGKQPSKKDLLNQWKFYLEGVNTPTSLRLLSDLNKGKIHYADGSFMRYIF